MRRAQSVGDEDRDVESSASDSIGSVLNPHPHAGFDNTLLRDLTGPEEDG